MKLLHLDSSIQGDASVSRAISKAIVERLRQPHDGIDVEYRDLAADPLPHITLPGFAAEAAAAVLDQFMSADIVVIGAPMYNFGISSQLKSWFDHILVAGKTFRYGANGAEGLAGEKKVYVALSRGGLYGADSPAASHEHAEAHLRSLLGFIGVTDVEFVVAEGVAMGPEQREAASASAFERVGRLEPLALAA